MLFEPCIHGQEIKADLISLKVDLLVRKAKGEQVP
jgi:hypothetical protein